MKTEAFAAISRAPANLMLLGEHSVVYGHSALACAVDRFIEIDWQASDDEGFCIDSDLAQYAFTLEELKSGSVDHPSLRFVIEALKVFAADLNQGLLITIRSEFSSTVGLGSSAAVLAAMLHGLNQITQRAEALPQLFETGLNIIRGIQGRGSGTDLAASLYGGVIHYQPGTGDRSATIERLPEAAIDALPITLLYSGYKTPTAQVLEQVAQQWQARPERLSELYALMGHVTNDAAQALKSDRPGDFFQLCNVYQGLMDALGVNDATLSEMIYALRGCESIQAAKISGSGLGDCVLGFGNLSACFEERNNRLQPYQRIDVSLSPEAASTALQIQL